jgi:hypothetical protein
MRQRAQEATDGPWSVASWHHNTVMPTKWAAEWGRPASGDRGPFAAMTTHEPADAEHIASWHPLVALAVADWLDVTADRIDAGRPHRNGGRSNHGWRGTREARAVADAYLGGAS